MSAREWFEGDLAIVTTKSGREYRAVYTLAPGIDYFWRQIDHERLRGKLTDPDVDARPLVVIDPEDREQVERLRVEYHRLRNTEKGLTATDHMQAALREFANPTPPKPDEPTAYLAAVVDSDGNRWHISGGPTDRDRRWYSPDLNKTRAYADIKAVRILSAGVES